MEMNNRFDTAARAALSMQFCAVMAACGGGRGEGSSAGPAAPPMAGPAPAPVRAPSGQSGCGLASAAFCETFDRPATSRGRAGQLEIARWSAGRAAPQLPSGNGAATGIGPATLRPCRSDLPAQALPPNDTLVCDANGALARPHLMMTVGAQDYGQNSLRIRQPFDFTGRTGQLVFDVDATVENGLPDWASIEVVEDRTPVASFVFDEDNDEDGSVPRNGFELPFQNRCLNAVGPPVNPPFSRGDVSISGHNHATLKYGDNQMDAWNRGGPAQTLRLRNAVLRCRLNGEAWHAHRLGPEEHKLLTGLDNGQISPMPDVPLADLVQGDNTLEFVTMKVPQSYPPLVQNIDLALETR